MIFFWNHEKEEESLLLQSWTVVRNETTAATTWYEVPSYRTTLAAKQHLLPLPPDDGKLESAYSETAVVDRIRFVS